MNKKILILSSELNPKSLGGIQTFCRVLKEMFHKNIVILTRKNIENSIYELDDIKEISVNNIFVRIINRISNYMIENYLYEKIIEKENPDIILINSPQKIRFIKKFKKYIILVQHTTYDRYLQSKYYFNNDSEIINEVKSCVDKFICLSPYDEEKFKKELNFFDNKITNIRHSSSIPLNNIPKQFNKTLIMITRISNKYKRIDLAIKAMKFLDDYILEIWGDGPDKKELEELLKQENIKNVKFMGSTSKVIEVLDKAGIYVITSDFEGYPMSGIEAIRRGLPIIIRNTFDSARDLIHNNGVLLDRNWDINKFIEGVKTIERNYKIFSKESLTLGERYNFSNIKKEWEKIFEGANK